MNFVLRESHTPFVTFPSYQSLLQILLPSAGIWDDDLFYKSDNHHMSEQTEEESKDVTAIERKRRVCAF